MAEAILKATNRDVIGKRVKALRREGKLPAVVYGRRISPIPVLLDTRETSRLFDQHSSSALLTIDLEGEEYPVLIRDVQRDVITQDLLHVDFLAVTMGEKLRTEIMLDFIGESPAVSEYGAILVTEMDRIEIECLPSHLVDRFTVDVSVLTEIGSSILVRDLTIPEEIDVLVDLDDQVALVIAPSAEIEEEEEEEEDLSFAEPEVVERGKREEEESEE